MVPHRELRDKRQHEGSYVTVERGVRPLRAAAVPEMATARFEPRPSAQAEADCGRLEVWIGAEKVTIHLFVVVLVLGYSRRTFAPAHCSEKLGNALDGHDI
ncbi:MAG: hypothetical protein ACSLFQ_06550 [Thermoanaerobaculia bacterium]